MSCPPFDVKVRDVKAALDKVKKAISGKGSISGDEKKGSSVFSDSSLIAGEYTIKGSYTADNNTITISNDIKAENWFVVPVTTAFVADPADCFWIDDLLDAAVDHAVTLDQPDGAADFAGFVVNRSCMNSRRMPPPAPTGAKLPVVET